MCNDFFNVCLPSRRKVLGRAEFTKVCLVHCWVHRVGAEWREVIFSTSKVKNKTKLRLTEVQYKTCPRSQKISLIFSRRAQIRWFQVHTPFMAADHCLYNSIKNCHIIMQKIKGGHLNWTCPFFSFEKSCINTLKKTQILFKW